MISRKVFMRALVPALFFCALLFCGPFCVVARAETDNARVDLARFDHTRYEKFTGYIQDALKAFNVDHDKDMAAALFRAALIVDPESPEVHYALSQLEEPPKVVINHCLQAIKYRPYLNPALARMDTTLLALSDARLYETLGAAYKRTGELDKAEYYLEKVIQDNTNAHRMGLSYLNLGEIAKPKDADKALELMKKGWAALFAAGDKDSIRIAKRGLWKEGPVWSFHFFRKWNELPDLEDPLFILFLRAASFFLFCLFLYTLADKEDASRLWLAWVPVGQWFLVCEMAGLTWYYAVLMFPTVLPVIGMPLAIIVKTFFVTALLITLRGPVWLAVFTASGLPFIDLVPWAFLALRPEKSGKDI